MTSNHFYGVFSLQSGKISVKLEPGRIEFARQLLMGETTPGATRVARRPTHWLPKTAMAWLHKQEPHRPGLKKIKVF